MWENIHMVVYTLTPIILNEVLTQISHGVVRAVLKNLRSVFDFNPTQFLAFFAVSNSRWPLAVGTPWPRADDVVGVLRSAIGWWMVILLESSSQRLSYSKLLHKESEKQSQTSRPIKEDAGGQKNQRVKRRVRVPAFRHPYKHWPFLQFSMLDKHWPAYSMSKFTSSSPRNRQGLDCPRGGKDRRAILRQKTGDEVPTEGPLSWVLSSCIETRFFWLLWAQYSAKWIRDGTVPLKIWVPSFAILGSREKQPWSCDEGSCSWQSPQSMVMMISLTHSAGKNNSPPPRSNLAARNRDNNVASAAKVLYP